jgi:hypothetical protein
VDAEGTTKGKVRGNSLIAHDTSVRMVVVGLVERPVLDGAFHIPISAPMPSIGWEYVCTAAHAASTDPALVGTRWHVVNVPIESHPPPAVSTWCGYEGQGDEHLGDLIADFEKVAVEGPVKFRGVVKEGIRVGNIVAKDFARESAGAHGKLYHRAFSAEMHRGTFRRLTSTPASTAQPGAPPGWHVVRVRLAQPAAPPGPQQVRGHHRPSHGPRDPRRGARASVVTASTYPSARTSRPGWRRSTPSSPR